MNKLFLLVMMSFVWQKVFPQHAHHMPAKKDTTAPRAIMRKDSCENNMGHPIDISMSHAFSLNLPMNRNGSGTGWLPDVSPIYGYMMHSRKWMYMIHGNLFIRYTNQDIGNKGTRGNHQFDAPNWLMLMSQRKVGQKGLFHYNVMLSFDRLTEGGNGYPLLFQSGESWKDQPLVDRQHPHDLFSELSVSYTYAFSKKIDAFAYFGYPGEPAIGSVAFMHRPSAFSNPDAPISHHWNDGTHITFGVATLGVRLNNFKLEGSLFTGREPDENRYNFDKMRFDSWSGRISCNPSNNWAFQVSHGYIKSPELLHPDKDMHRTTAAAIFSKLFRNDSWLNLTSLWGLNKTTGHDGENAFLVEGALRLRKAEFYTRYEWVQKSVEELNLDPINYGEASLFLVNTVTAGLSYDFFRSAKARLALGGQFSIFFDEAALIALYGKNPMAIQVYLRLYPQWMKMKRM